MRKTCTKCNVEKSLNAENFNKRKSSKDGFRNECKSCLKEYRQKYYEENKADIIKKNDEYRKNNWDRFTRNRIAYEARNKEKLREWARGYHEENMDEIRRKQKIHREENKEYYANYYLQWARDNVDKAKAKRHRRDARIRELPYTLTIEEWNENLEHFDNACSYCGSKENIEKEHFIALTKGGGYTKENIIPACRPCNSSKNNSCFFEWYPKQDHYCEEREIKITNYLNVKREVPT